MRSAILMGSVAMVALAMPAFAAPDRYEQGYSCTGQGAMCTQQQLRLDDGNRGDEKTPAGAVNRSIDQTGTDGSQAAARTDNDDNFGDEAGDEIENTADEAGDEISDAADDVGDEVSDAFD